MTGAAVWLRATRPGFLVVMGLAVVLGTALARHATGRFDVLPFALALLAGLLWHAAANVFNDYVDGLSGADAANTTPLTPFAGGSRVIQEGALGIPQARRLATALALAALLASLPLAWFGGAAVLAIGLAGMAIGWCYSGAPLRLNYRGAGEGVIAACFGLLPVAGAFAVQTGSAGASAWLAGLPVAIAAAAILLVNEFPDEAADRLAGKRTAVVVLGRRRALVLLRVLALAQAGVLGLAVHLDVFPTGALVGLIGPALLLVAAACIAAAPATRDEWLIAVRAALVGHGMTCLGPTVALLA